MAQYDGAIRIATKITTKDATESLAGLEWKIKKSAKYMDELRSKMDTLKDQKIPTKDYEDLQKNLAAAEKELQELISEQERYNELGLTSGGVWDTLNEKVATASDKVDLIKEKMQSLTDAGKDFTLGKDTAQYKAYDKQLQYEEQAVTEAARHYKALLRTNEGYKKLKETAKSAFTSIGNVLKKANSAANAFGRKIKEIAQKHFHIFRRETEKAKSSLSGFAGRLKSLALSLLIFNQISAAFRRVSSAISEGFKNLYNDNENFKNSIDNLNASVLTLKNAFAAAFRPLVDIALPYIEKIVECLTHAVNLAGQFFAALTGRKSYTRAIKQTAKASGEAADAIEEETEAMKKQLSPLDDLNNLTSENNKQKDKGKDEIGSGTGIMFEEVPIDSKIQEMADKVKNILSKLFEPLKKAWNREGKFVMDSWKYALKEVWKLIKDIGRDFLEVWQQEKTVKIFEDLLHIIGDIGLVVGHLARNFRDAWNENKTGLHILENIRDIIGVIIHNFRLAADKTVEWADKLNFSPILEAFERFTKSLIPVADALSGVLSDFYTMVLLPLAKWTIEEGLPKLLDVFTAFNEKVDWKALRDNLAEFWEHLEPFAETVGEGLILFIERVSDALANFINSDAFENFLTRIEEWMDGVTPEDVANALTGIAEALIALKIALLGFSAVSAVAGAFTTIKTFLGFIAGFGGLVANGAKLVAGGVSGIVASLGGILPALALVSAAVVGWDIGTWINEKLLGVDTPSFAEMMEGIKSSFTDGSWKEALNLWGEDIKWAWSEIWGYAKEDFNNTIRGQVLGSFKDGTWRDAMRLWGNDIYDAFVTLGERQEEWLRSLKEKWLKTWDGIKTNISGIISSIKSTVGSDIDFLKNKLDSLKTVISSIGSGFAKSPLLSGRSPLLSGRSYSYSTEPYSYHPAIAKLSNIEIPKLATGAVLPANREFLALVGDQKHGTNIEAPLSTIEEAVINAMAKVNANSENNGGGSVTIEIPVIINGIGEIGRAVQKFDKEFFKQNHRHAFT